MNSWKVATLAVLAVAGRVAAQSDDVMWHNRYHALLAMSAYGDYNSTCPQVFTKQSQDYYLNLAPWTVLESFGPTPSGAQGYTVVIPEMAKVVIVFKGDYSLEASLDPSVTGFDYIGLGNECSGCTVNAFAAKGYMEAKKATNNWARARKHFQETGLKWSVTGHGLGGMHSLIASVDLGMTNEVHYSHCYGTPRTFNPAGAALYNQLFQGEAAERGVANNDRFSELIPRSSDYEHVNSAFLYTGQASPYGMNYHACWDEPESAACMPLKPYDEASHYFYFTEPGECGVSYSEDYDEVYGYLYSQTKAFAKTAAAGATTIPHNYNPSYTNPWNTPTTTTTMTSRNTSTSTHISTSTLNSTVVTVNVTSTITSTTSTTSSKASVNTSSISISSTSATTTTSALSQPALAASNLVAPTSSSTSGALRTTALSACAILSLLLPLATLLA